MQVVIVISGFSFSGKTTAGKELAARLTNCFHLDDDNIRHALFPRNSEMSYENRSLAYQQVRKAMVEAAELNLEIGHSLVLTSTFGQAEAKSVIVDFWKRIRPPVPCFFFNLFIPEEVREELVQKRAIERYGNEPTILKRKLERYEHMRKITVSWPEEIKTYRIDGSQSIDEVCKQIMAHMPW